MDDKVYVPEVIQESPFPGEPVILDTQSQASIGGTYSPATTNEKSFPRKKLATELLSTALNTRSKRILQEFALQDTGGFKVGDFKEGISGDLRITPNGLTARDIVGLTTFAIDGLTGDAYFRGSLVLGGDLTIQNEEGTAIIDSSGIISSTNFNANQAIDTVGQTTVSSSYVNLDTPQLTFTASLTRNVNILFFGTLTMSTGGSSSGNVILTLEDDISLGGTMILANTSSGCIVAIKTSISPGEHTLKFMFKRGSAVSVSITTDPALLGYLILGN